MAISVFWGDDRAKIGEEVINQLGEGYEVFEGESLLPEDLPSVFLGTTLFSSEQRRILIKDLGENKEAFDELVGKIDDYNKTDAMVIIWESKLDKRTAAAKALVKSGIEMKEYKAASVVDTRSLFNIFDMALVDGTRAVKELEKIENVQDPYMFLGLLTSQALKRFEQRVNGRKERAVLKELAKVDMQMKSTAVEPWILIKSFLLVASSL